MHTSPCLPHSTDLISSGIFCAAKTKGKINADSYRCHLLPRRHFAISCWQSRLCRLTRSEEGWEMRCQVRERGCLCQEALTRAAYSPISSAGRRQRAHPAQPQARGKRSPGKDQHVQAANYLPPSPFPAPNTNSLVLTLPEMAAVSVLSGRTSLSKCEPGCESRPLGTAQLSPQPEYAPRPEALQEGLTLKK